MIERDPNASMWEDIAVCMRKGRADDLLVGENYLIDVMRNAGIPEEHVEYVLRSRTNDDDANHEQVAAVSAE